MLFMEDDNHGVFREEWCGRGKTVISRYLRSDSGKNKVSDQSTRIDKKRKVLFRASFFRMDNIGVTIEGKDLNLNISIIVICHKKVHAEAS